MRRMMTALFLLLTFTQTAHAQTDCPTPEVSPTPIRVVYVEDDDLWLWDIHQDPTQVLPQHLIDSGDVSSVSLSDDGQLIVFTRQITPSQPELWAINSDGTNEHLLVSAAQFRIMRTETPPPDGYGIFRMEWIPGTHTIAFNTRVFYDDGLYIPIADDLWTVNVNTGELVNVLPRGEGGEFIYSPDGSQIAVMTVNSLSLVNADGSNRRDDVLESFQAIGFGEYYDFPQVQWSADSTTLNVIINASETPYSQHNGAVEVWTIDSQTLAAYQPMWVVMAFYPSAVLSPDAQYLAYWNTDEEGSNRRFISIVQIDTIDVVYAHGDNLLDFLAWSPNSRDFAYRDALNQIWLTDVCNEQQRLLTISRSRDNRLVWVDSGRYLLVDEDELYLNTLDDMSVRLSTIATAFDFVVLSQNA